MEKKDFSLLWQNLYHLIKKLPNPGMLLATGDKLKENIMTVGWLQFGILWNEPTASILVRPSRFTYDILNNTKKFTLNVLPEKLNEKILFCGTNSGSYCDKFKETGLTKGYTSESDTIFIKESEIIIDCQVVLVEDIIPDNLSDIYIAKYYDEGDYHTIFTGIITDYKINF
jgi:flavin reductase (DIM6/NTAB) family NADH-FMN oxidoreductase RutF